DPLKELGEGRVIEPFHPNRWVGTPYPEIQTGQPSVGVGMADGGNEEGHFFVTGSYVGQRVPVPEDPACAIGALYLIDDSGSAERVGGEQRGRVRQSAPPAEDEGYGENEV